MSIDLQETIRRLREQEQRDRWTLAFTGKCPRCEGKGYNRYDCYVSGEIEIFPCDFCRSEAELEKMHEDS